MERHVGVLEFGMLGKDGRPMVPALDAATVAKVCDEFRGRGIEVSACPWQQHDGDIGWQVWFSIADWHFLNYVPHRFGEQFEHRVRASIQVGVDRHAEETQ